jgi:hypothetical protein
LNPISYYLSFIIWFKKPCHCGFPPVVAGLSARMGEKVVENPQKILPNKRAVKYFQIALAVPP